MNKKINFIAPLCYTGYGVASYNIYKELCKLHEITVFPIAIDDKLVDKSDIENMFKYRISSEWKNNVSFKIFHAKELYSSVGNGEIIGYPFFELDKLFQLESNIINNLDKIVVSSNWAKQIIEEETKQKNIFVAPLGVDRTIFDHTIYKNNKSDKYIFSIIGKWEIRKGHDILLHIFEKAFTDQDDVELWVCASADNGYINAQEIFKWEALYKNHKLSDKIKLIPAQKTHHDIAKLISKTDCGLYPSRAEGWNLELLETMSMNRPTIALNYSAQTEFCNNKNCFLVDVEETEPAHDGKFFMGQGNWAKIGSKQIDDIVDKMRFCYKNNIKTNPEGVETAKRFSWQNTAKCVSNCIEY